MFRENCRILENKKVAPSHYLMRFGSPFIGRDARPGQFVQLSCDDSCEPLLPRPFSFLDASNKEFSILYQVVGTGTRLLSQKKTGDRLWVLGPLGNGFTLEESRQKKVDRKQKEAFSTGHCSPATVILVGGGVGIPPLYHLAKTLIRRYKHQPSSVFTFIGAKNKSLLLCEKDLRKIGLDVKVSTDDGSKGRKGLVTGVLEDWLKKNDARAARIYTCGPTLMLKAVSSISIKYGVCCEASIEVPMACGFGACLGCAVKVRKEADSGQKTEDRRQKETLSAGPCLPSSDYRYAIACTEGPVFQAKDLVWE